MGPSYSEHVARQFSIKAVAMKFSMAVIILRCHRPVMYNHFPMLEGFQDSMNSCLPYEFEGPVPPSAQAIDVDILLQIYMEGDLKSHKEVTELLRAAGARLMSRTPLPLPYGGRTALILRDTSASSKVLGALHITCTYQWLHPDFRILLLCRMSGMRRLPFMSQTFQVPLKLCAHHPLLSSLSISICKKGNQKLEWGCGVTLYLLGGG